MPETLQISNPAPLTTLTDDEILFRDNVRHFAEDKIRPAGQRDGRKAVFDHGLLDQFFQLGLMGIEIPEQYGGAGGRFLKPSWRLRNFAGRRFRRCHCRRAEHIGGECDSALGH